MAIALVQSTSKQHNGVNNTTLAYTSNVTINNLLAVSHAHWVGAVSSITTPTDTRSNTYAGIAAEQSMAANNRLRSFYAINASTGACTVTFDIGTTASNGDMTVTVAEFSGNVTSSVLDVTNLLGPTASTAVSSGDVTPSTNDQLLYAAGSHTGADTAWTQEGGWTLIAEYESGSSGMPISVVYKVQTTATTEDADWTLGASRTWCAHVGSFKSGAPPAAALPPSVFVLQAVQRAAVR